MNRFIIGIVLVLCMGLYSCKPTPPPPAPPVPVNLITVSAKQVFYYDKYPSTTQALSQVDLRPQVQGYITGIFFTEGTHVRKGQTLYEIDKRLYQANLDAAIANVKVAQGSELQAQQDADRYQYLIGHDAVAKQVLDHAIITLQNAKSSVQSAQEAVKTAQTNLSYSVITAPFDGTIGFSQVKLGNMVSVGSTILNTISTDDPMAVDFLISEAQLSHYEDLADGKVKIDSLFTLGLPDHSQYAYEGKISVIDRAVDPQTGTVRVRLVFPNPQNDLRVGMSCIVQVHNQESKPQIVIPNKAVVEQMGEFFVFVVKDTIIASSDSSHKKKAEAEAANATPGPVAFQKKIILGQTIGANVVVKQGLEEGEKVVIDGVQAIHDGSKVNTSNKPPQDANAKGGASGKGAKGDNAASNKKPE